MPFRVLSIDGGGMRGIYTATFLEAMEQAFAKKRNISPGLDVGKAFQLIVGTSTGAIIGCGLAKGVSPGKITKMYKEHSADIFPKKMPSKINSDLICQLKTRPRYLKKGDAALTTALSKVFGNMTVSQVWENRRIALAIPAVNMANYNAWVFKTPHDPKSNHRDDNYTLVDICRASSAAPLFRSLAAVDHASGNTYNVFTDGGLWANNPVIVALVESLRMTDGQEEEIEIFCLGTCGKPEGELIGKDFLDRGLLEWKFGGEAAKVSIASQEYAFDMIAGMLTRHLKKTVRIVRFPSNKIPGSMLQYLDLDEIRPEGLNALIGQAQSDADKTNSEIQQGSADGRLIEALFNDMPQLVVKEE